MQLTFPEGFLLGTATSAGQTETAFDHQFKGLEAADGFILERTIDHEQRREEDLTFIRLLGNSYRCGVDWSRLQRAPLAPLEAEVVDEYRQFFRRLNESGITIMLVLHHFAHPRWFEQAGGWEKEEHVAWFVDFARRCHQAFHPYVAYWNTFNEPNVYAAMAFLLGRFPPFRRWRYRRANRVLRHMGQAHAVFVDLVRAATPGQLVGIAHNVAWFAGRHPLGRLPARLCDWWFNRRAAGPFRHSDFWGINYYAYVPFNPLPLTEIERPGRLARLGIAHDRMWGYRPEGLGRFVRYFYRTYRRPVIVTETGICTDDAGRRIAAIRDYLGVCHECLNEGVDLRGYFHWSTFDNFEWHLGPSHRFGLVEVNWHTKERRMTRAGEFFRQIVQRHGFEP